MSCTICAKTNPIPSCFTTLNIGTVPNAATDVYVYIQNVTTGRKIREAVKTSGAGLVTITEKAVGEGCYYSPQFTYDVWVTLQTNDIKLPITIGGVANDCINMVFEDIWVDGEKETIVLHTITLE